VLTLDTGAEIIPFVTTSLPELTDAKLHRLFFFLNFTLCSASRESGTGAYPVRGKFNVSIVANPLGSGGTGGGGELLGDKGSAVLAAVFLESERTREASCRGHSASRVREARAK